MSEIIDKSKNKLYLIFCGVLDLYATNFKIIITSESRARIKKTYKKIMQLNA